MGEQVTQEWDGQSIWGGNYEENSVRNEAKGRIRNIVCDVLCICVGIGDVLLTMAMGSDDECRKTKLSDER